ncbi:MAG: hypothetical protein J5699_00655 [Bacteroidales bacterium]|nr:hypothetical protein [Bacteroidales bacterium]
MILTLVIAAAVLMLAVLAMGAAVFFRRSCKKKKAGENACPEGGCEGCAFYSSTSSARS